MKPLQFGSALALIVIIGSLTNCERASPSGQTPPGQTPDPRPELRVVEAERRAHADFTTLPPSDRGFGPDPYAIVPIADAKRFVSILRGSDALVVLDASARELTRVATPASPSGLAVSSDGQTVFVVGERSGFVARYAVQKSAPYLVAAGRYDLPDVRGLRDIAVGSEGVLYAVEEQRGRLITLFPEATDVPPRNSVVPARRHDMVVGVSPVRVARVGKFVLTNSVVAHELVIRSVNEDGSVRDAGEVRVKHDGPIWSFSARASGDDLLVLVGGVEDHPLDRSEGFFGYIDSFVFLYRVSGGKAERLSAVNVSEFGVVTPKAVLLEQTVEGKLAAFVTGYGGERYVWFVFGGADKPPSEVRIGQMPAGACALASRAEGGFVIANPLLDAFVLLRLDDKKPGVVRLEGKRDDPHRHQLRLGETLFFTNLMAPNNPTDGAHSRFSCETCHFEGYVDGRVHHTGRGDVRVATKPLLGLFNNRPHFSRALDPDLSSVAHAEFRVAGAGSEHSPWFGLEPAAHPTLAAFNPSLASSLSPLELRLALMQFLMDFSHRTNPAIEGRTAFTPLEQEGATAFRDRCESCHQARTSTDEPQSRLPFDRWESLVFSPSGPIVWAQSDYRKTGVEPYVHELGARVPSLRRLYKKHPYLTSGVAKDLENVLQRVGSTDDGTFFHDRAPEGAKRLSRREVEAIRAFLELL